MHTTDKPMADTRERVTILTAKDLDISYFRGSGNGGQNKQKTSSGVQMVHRESGAIGRASDTRCQVTNKKTAFRRLMGNPKMKVWLAAKVYAVQNQETIEQCVERQMQPHNLKIEGKVEGRWQTIS